MMLSKKAMEISPSLTLAITAKAKKMKAEGIDVIGFGAGEPDFNTPKNIQQAAIKAIEAGQTRYTAASGIIELKEAVVNKFKKDNNLTYKTSQIIISTGAKQCLANIFQAKKTKAMILNSPNNPTGTAYTKEELEKIATFAQKHDIIIISDEIYEKLLYGESGHISIASLSEDAYNRTIVINGVSKAYAMTGWRIGYAAASEKITSLMSNIQSHTTSNPCSISQYASVEALNGDQSEVEKMKQEFKKRRDFMVDKINSINNLSCVKPEGAFYVMVNISKVLNKEVDGKIIKDSLTFSDLLLEKEKVAVIPGIAFGVDDFIRLSYATSMENIEKGLNRIEDFVNGIK